MMKVMRFLKNLFLLNSILISKEIKLIIPSPSPPWAKIEIQIKGEGSIFLKKNINKYFEVYVSRDDTFNFFNLNEKSFLIFNGRTENWEKIPLFIKINPLIIEKGEYDFNLTFIKIGKIEFRIEDEDVWIKEKDNDTFIIYGRIERNIINTGEKVKIEGGIENNYLIDSVKIEFNLPENLTLISPFVFDGKEFEILKDKKYFVNVDKILPGIHHFHFFVYAEPFKEPGVSYISLSIISKNKKISLWTGYLEVKSGYFEKYGIISGRVVDEKLKGIGGIKIVLDDGRITYTDKNGNFAFHFVKPGYHIVYINGVEKDMELPEGGIYNIELIMRKRKLYPKREIILIYIGDLNISFEQKKREKIFIEGIGNLYVEGEVKEDLFIKLLINSKGKKLDDIFYYIRPETRYKILRGNREEEYPGKFYLMIERKGDYLKAGVLPFHDYGRYILGFEGQGSLFPNFKTYSNFGFLENLYIKEEFEIKEEISSLKLKNFPIVFESERIFIETRNLRGELIEKGLLPRSAYNIDYQNGWIYFTRKISPSISPTFLVVYFYKIGNKDYDIRKSYGKIRQTLSYNNSEMGIFYEKEPTFPERFSSIGYEQKIKIGKIMIEGIYARRLENVGKGNRYNLAILSDYKFLKSNIIYEKYEKNSFLPVLGTENVDKEKIGGKLNILSNFLYLTPSFFYITEKNEIKRKGINFEIESGYGVEGKKIYGKYALTYGDYGNLNLYGLGFSLKNFNVFSFYAPEILKEGKKTYGMDFSYYKKIGFSTRNKIINYKGFYGFINESKINFSYKNINTLFNSIYQNWRNYPDILELSSCISFYFPFLKINTNYVFFYDFESKNISHYLFTQEILDITPSFSIFNETKFYKNLNSFENGLCFRPLFIRNFIILFSIKNEEYKNLKEKINSITSNFFFSPTTFLEIMNTNIFSFDNTYFHHLKFLIPFYKNVKIYVEEGYLKKPYSQDFGIGYGVLFDFKYFSLNFGMNRIGLSSIEKNKLRIDILPKGIKEFLYGLEENALDLLANVKIKTPYYVYLNTPFMVEIEVIDKDGEPFEEFCGDLFIFTKTFKGKIKFKGESKKKVKFKLTSEEELGINYILVRDKKGREWREFIRVLKEGEEIKFEEVKPYVEVAKPEEYLERFDVYVPKSAKPNEKFEVEIRAISNLGRIFTEYEGNVLIITSNKEKVIPDKVYFSKADKGVRRVELIYPSKEKIRIIVRDEKEKNKIGISETISFVEEIVVKPKEIKKPSPPLPPKEKIEELMKEGIELFSKGEYEKAKKVWLEILKYDPKNEKAKKYLEKTEKRIKK